MSGAFRIGSLRPRTDFRFEVSLSRRCPLRADQRPVGGPDRPRHQSEDVCNVPINRPIKRYSIIAYSTLTHRACSPRTSRSGNDRAGEKHLHRQFEYDFEYDLDA